jgi:hypothetical protein
VEVIRSGAGYTTWYARHSTDLRCWGGENRTPLRSVVTGDCAE